MAGDVQVGDLLVVLGVPGRVVHVSQMVLALDIVLVVIRELVLIGKLEKDCEEVEQLDDNFLVAFLLCSSVRSPSWVVFSVN
jgi:hypothetical protein